MRILIGYDGSDSAEKILDDLPRAGLPPQAEALLVSVDESQGSAFPESGDESPEHSAGTLEKSRALAVERLQIEFAGWTVGSESLAGSATLLPAQLLIDRAADWQADLIVVGAQGRSANSKLPLGSVARQVVTEANCSVRIVRSRQPQTQSPRILIGVDGLSGSESVVRAVASRSWPAGAEAKLLSAVLRAPLVIEAHPWREWYLVREAQLAAEPKLQAAGLTVSREIQEGDPKRTLLEEAERWEADSIFVGATGLHRVAQLLLGSVPAALCAQANCSVEVVRASFKGATDDFV